MRYKIYSKREFCEEMGKLEERSDMMDMREYFRSPEAIKIMEEYYRWY